MTNGGAVYSVEMGFLPPSVAVPDTEHPGLLRAGERASAPYGGESVDFHTSPATDWAHPDEADVDLLTHGFDVVDLTPLTDLQHVLAKVRDAGELTKPDAAVVRSELGGAVLHCASGLTLKVLQLAGEGLFMRKSGPNRMSVVPPRSVGMNGHGAATSVHADQDVFGTPLTQLMDGRAPTLLRHDSPDGHNHDARLVLVNLWIPLQQITQPLMLADGRSIDRRRHQLRYGLRTESFLDRDDDMAVNDIWTFLHDPGQRWYFRSEMDHRSAYVFDTLSTPHGAGVLPGEDLAERCYRALDEAEEAIGRADVAGVAAATADPDLLALADGSTPPLRLAIEAMQALIEAASHDPRGVCGPHAPDWSRRSRVARRAVVRMSLELRLVATIES